MGRANILCKREVNGNAQRISGSITGNAIITSLQYPLYNTAIKINVFDPANATIKTIETIAISGESDGNATSVTIKNIKITAHAKLYSNKSAILSNIPTDACISVEGADVDAVLQKAKTTFNNIFGAGNLYYVKLFTFYIETEDN